MSKDRLEHLLFDFWAAVIVAFILALCLPVLQGHGVTLTPVSWLVPFAAALIAPQIIPLARIARWGATWLKAKPDTLGFTLVFDAFMSVFIFLIVGGIVLVYEGGVENWLARWIVLETTYMPFVYAAVVITEPVEKALACTLAAHLKRSTLSTCSEASSEGQSA